MARRRLQKIIADAGLASRRKAEGWITAGRVRVDGEVVRAPGAQADPERQRIEVDGEPLPTPGHVYLLLNKPVGVVTSVSDPHAERVVLDLLGDEVRERVFPAGRLDRDSEGLVLLTNDGELMNAMTRPGGAVEKTYHVVVRGRPTEADLRRLRAGLEIGGRQLLPCRVEPRPGDGVDSGCSAFEVGLHEGMKRQIRRIFDAVGCPVVRLVRVAIGPLRLGDLGAGAYRAATEHEIDGLRRLAGLAPAHDEAGE